MKHPHMLGDLGVGDARRDRGGHLLLPIAEDCGRWAAVSAARDEVGRLPEVEDFANVVGLGVQSVVVDGERCHAVLVGRSRLLGVGAEAARGLDRAFGAAQVKGTTAAQGWHGQARDLLVVADAIKPTSTVAIATSASSV